MINRWGHNIIKGAAVLVYGFGGHYPATVRRLDPPSAFSRAYGRQCELSDGRHCGIDDCTIDTPAERIRLGVAPSCIVGKFDRFDICGAYLALENDWNNGGWLNERPSNRRRRESCGVQLARIGYSPGVDQCCGFEYLQNDNQRAIYVNALIQFGMAPMIDPKDSTHRGIVRFIQNAGMSAHFSRVPT